MDWVLFTFENKSSAHAHGGVCSVGSFITIYVMDSFNKIKADIFIMQALVSGVFPVYFVEFHC